MFLGAFYIIFGLSFFFFSRRYYVPRQMQYATDSGTVASSLNSSKYGFFILYLKKQLNRIKKKYFNHLLILYELKLKYITLYSVSQIVIRKKYFSP